MSLTYEVPVAGIPACELASNELFDNFQSCKPLTAQILRNNLKVKHNIFPNIHVIKGN